MLAENPLITAYADLSRTTFHRYVRGSGAYVFLEDGRAILDGLSGAMNANLGHGNEAVATCLLHQARGLCAMPALGSEYSEPSYTLAVELRSLLGHGIASTAFYSGGSEAVEAALAIAWTYWNQLGLTKKRLVLSQTRSYHGCTMGALSVTGREEERRYISDIIPGIRIELPAWDPVHPRQVSACLKSMLSRHHCAEQIAAIILEPVMGLAGMRPAPEVDIQEVVSTCKENRILVIVDEVLTGLGRTGRLLASDWYAITPDIIVLSKGLGCGFVPIASVSLTGQIDQVLRSTGAVLLHGHSASGSALVCNVAREVLRELQRLDAVNNADNIGATILQSLRESLSGLSSVREVRGLGMCIGLELEHCALANSIVDKAFERGLRVRALDSSVLLAPPLVSSRQTALLLVSRLVEAIEDACRRL